VLKALPVRSLQEATSVEGFDPFPSYRFFDGWLAPLAPRPAVLAFCPPASVQGAGSWASPAGQLRQQGCGR